LTLLLLLPPLLRCAGVCTLRVQMQTTVLHYCKL
jgi:hypothetical protein